MTANRLSALFAFGALFFTASGARADGSPAAQNGGAVRSVDAQVLPATFGHYPFGFHRAYRYPFSYRYYSYGPYHYSFGNGPYGPYGSNYGGYTGNMYGYGTGYGSGYGYGYAAPGYANPGWNWYGSGTYGYGSYGMPGSYAYGYDPWYSGQWQYNYGMTGAYGYGSAYGYPYSYPGYSAYSPYLSIYGNYGAPWYGYPGGNAGWGFYQGW